MKNEKPEAAATPELPPLVKLSSLKANISREFDGDWVELPQMPGAAVNVRSFNFPPYKVARDFLNRRLGKKYGVEPSAEREAEENEEFGRLYAKHLLRGWRGFDVEYSPATALDLLPDPEWRPLKEYVGWAAMRLSEIEVQFVETSAKNSAKSSATA